MGKAINATWDQDSYRFRNDDGSETTATWMAAANTTPADIPLDTIFRLRFLVQETAGSNQAETPTFTWQFRVNTGSGFGSWTNPQASGTAAVRPDSPNYVEPVATTKQLGAGTFRDGDLIDTGGVTGLLAATAGNDEYEIEIAISFNSALASAGDIFEFRLLVSTGSFTTLNTYTRTPSVTVASGPALQTVTPNHISSGQTVHNPSMIQTQTVSPNAIASGETVHDPTIQTRISVAPNAIATGETVHEPTITQGPATVTPDHIASLETVYEPTLLAQAVTAVPDHIASSETVHEPTLTTSITVTPDTIASGETLYDPTLLPQSVTVTPDHIASGETVYDPTLGVGQQTVVPDHIASGETVHEPTLLAGSVTITPNAIASGETVHEPTAIQSGGGQTVIPDHIAIGETVHNPSLAPGAVTVTPDVITSGETVHQPTLAEFTASEIVVSPGAGGGGAARKRREAAAIAPFIRWGKKKRKKPAEQVKEVASAVMQVVRQADKVPEINVNVPVEIDYKQIAEQLLEQKKLSELRQQQFDTFAKAVSVTLKRAEREIINREDEEVLLMALW